MKSFDALKCRLCDASGKEVQLSQDGYCNGNEGRYICQKCSRIAIPLIGWDLVDLYEERLYVFYEAKKECGIDEYKQMRDKLIKKLDDFKNRQLQEERRKKDEIIERIRGWT